MSMTTLEAKKWMPWTSACKLAKDARKFNDYRKMLDEVGKEHRRRHRQHTRPHARAGRFGRHPPGQTLLRAKAADALHLRSPHVGRSGPAAKCHAMGNQGTATNPLREMASMRKAVLSARSRKSTADNRPVWPQGDDVKIEEKEAPPTCIGRSGSGGPKCGPTARRIIRSSGAGSWTLAPALWATWRATPSTCPFMGLTLKDPLSVQARDRRPQGLHVSAWSVITFEFPALGRSAAPCAQVLRRRQEARRRVVQGYAISAARLVVREKGTLYAPGDDSETRLRSHKERTKDPSKIKSRILGGDDRPKVDWVKSPGHFEDGSARSKVARPPASNFADYAGPLTEVILLGNLAVWAAPQKGRDGQEIEWDAKALNAKRPKSPRS